MLCPRCPDKSLDEVDRHGVTVDVCPTCRGIWLDRGELERLAARQAAVAGPGDRDAGLGHDDDDDDRRRGDDDGRDDDGRGDLRDDRTPPRRKRGMLALLGDLFD